MVLFAIGRGMAEQKRGEHSLAREQRKLAAILAADVVGYSRLMGRKESGTLARFRSTTEQQKPKSRPGPGGAAVGSRSDIRRTS